MSREILRQLEIIFLLEPQTSKMKYLLILLFIGVLAVSFLESIF